MKGTGSFLNLYLYEGVVDFRKSIDGLSAIVESEINVNIFSDSAFIFVSRSRCRIKVLYWDKTGFALWHKRLEKDRFILPKSRA